MAFAAKSARKPKTLDPPALFEYAVRSLASQMRTVANLKRMLRRRVEPGEPGEAAVEAVLLKLRQLNYLNDTRFAADYTRLRMENEKFGRRRVQQDLMQRGVPSPLIATTLAAAYDDKDELTLCRRYIERKRMKQPTEQKETTRIVGRLLRAGFSTGIIYKALRNWNIPEESLEGLDTADDENPAFE